MPIMESEWLSISNLARKISEQVSGKRQDYFVTGKVVKVDAVHKLIYMAEFGDQAVPIVAWDYNVTYYDQTVTGATVKKTTVATVKMPKVGDTVLVARELGTRRLPRALGILQGVNWIVAEDE